MKNKMLDFKGFLGTNRAKLSLKCQTQEKGIKDTYQPEAGNDCLQFTEKGGAYTIWWEGARGMKEKLMLAAKHNLAGVALWRLGYEEAEFWE